METLEIDKKTAVEILEGKHELIKKNMDEEVAAFTKKHYEACLATQAGLIEVCGLLQCENQVMRDFNTALRNQMLQQSEMFLERTKLQYTEDVPFLPNVPTTVLKK